MRSAGRETMKSRVDSAGVLSLAFALALWCAIAGCGHRVNTQIVVRIDSDLQPATELVGVHVVVRRPNRASPSLDRTYLLGTGSGTFQLPGEVGIVATDPEDQGEVTVELTAVLASPGATPLVTRATAAFQRGHTLELDMFLSRACQSVPSCPTGQSCGLCGCEPDARGALGDLRPARDRDAATVRDAVAGACEPVHAPTLPSDLGNRSTCGDTSVPERVFAASGIQLGFPPRTTSGMHGFDLDNVCTDPASRPSTASCITPSGGGLAMPDGDHGRDNSFGAHVGLVLEQSRVLEEGLINNAMQTGHSTIGIRIRDYGGGANDGQVTLELLPLVHGHRPSNPRAMPTWDGHDVWHIDPTIAYDPMRPGMPAIHIDTGYVVDGVLVGHLQSHSRVIWDSYGTGYVRFTLSGTVLAGPISAGGTVLGAVDIGGWTTVEDARGDVDGFGLCPGSPIYGFVRSYLDTAADLYVVGDSVTVSPSTTCNAISVGMTMTWSQVTLGPDEANPNLALPDCGVFEGGLPPDVTLPPDVVFPFD